MNSQEAPANDRLDSWKEIAAYLKRDVTTVRRWEKREGLPVHRHLHDRRDSVYAYAAELNEWLAARGQQRTGVVETTPPRRKSAAIAIAVVAIAAAAMAGIANLRPTASDTNAMRLPFSVPPELTLTDAATGGQFSLSPDGRRLAVVASGRDGLQRLWIRALDSLVAAPLAGTENATYPFWSPDGQFVAFFAQRKLKTIAAGGGPVQALADAVLPRGGTWNREGVILFSVNAGEQLYRVSPRGGEVTRITIDQPNRESHWPSFLPDGRHFVYHGRRQQPGIYLGSLDSPETRLLATGYISAEYVAGHLLLVTGGTQSQTSGKLMAQRFDLAGLRLAGDATLLSESVAIRPQFARAVFSASNTGTVLYGTSRHLITQLVWLNRDGREVGTVTGPGRYERAALSPDERTVAVEVIDPQLETQDLWMVDASRGVTSRFTSEPSAERMPVWSPDGARLLFSSPRDGQPPQLFEKMATGGSEKPFFKSDRLLQPTDWSPDGKFIVYGRRDSRTQWDVWVVPAQSAHADRAPMVYRQTPYNEHHGHLSADGRWLAYASDESGRWEVYVGAFPPSGSHWQISNAGGVEPRWSADGTELFYVSPDGTLMAVALQFERATLRPATPQPLFKVRFGLFGADGYRPIYMPAKDRRFLANVVVEETAASPVTMILNWPAAMKGRAH